MLMIGVLAYLVVWFVCDLKSVFTIEMVMKHQAGLRAVVAHHYTMAVILYCVTLIVHSICALPATSFLFMLAGMLFGFYEGILYAWLSGVIGGTIIFLLAQSFLGTTLHRWYGHLLAPFKARINQHACLSLIIIRSIPIAPFCMTNILASLALIPLKTYFISLMIGIIPSVLLYVFIGTEMSRLAATLKILNNPLLVIGGVLLLALVIAIIHYTQRVSSRVPSRHVRR
jgi:uncharacterized membrane protein YdjX (TVP38/TMEM64 family)